MPMVSTGRGIARHTAEFTYVNAAEFCDAAETALFTVDIVLTQCVVMWTCRSGQGVLYNSYYIGLLGLVSIFNRYSEAAATRQPEH